MTMPGGPAAQQGWTQLGGGYDQATQQAQQQNRGQPQQQMQQDLSSPQQIQQQLNNNLPPQMQQFQPQQQVQPGQRFGDPSMLQHRNIQSFQQNQQAQQFAQQYNQQPPQQQMQAPQGLDLNARLTGPNIPADLQGRTVGEAIAIHNGMRQVHLQLMAQQQQQGAPSLQQPQPQIQGQPQAAPNGQNQGAGWDWRNPASSVGAVVDEKLGAFEQRLQNALAPTVQAGTTAAITNARNAAAASIGQAFTQFEPQIMQVLQGIDPRALTNPRAWEVAAKTVIGEAALRGQVQQPQQQQQRNGPGVYPQQYVQPGQQPLPNLNSFFSEQPNQGGPGSQGVQLTEMQRWAASQMGMSPEMYASFYTPAVQGGLR